MREHSVKTVRHEQSGGVHEGVWGDGGQAGVLVGGVQDVQVMVAAEGECGHKTGGGGHGVEYLETEWGQNILTIFCVYMLEILQGLRVAQAAVTERWP